LLAGSYAEPERTIIVSETLHAINGHRRNGAPRTVEAGIVRVADALDMARGRSRVPFEAGHQNIHSLSAYAIEEVKIVPGRDHAVRVEIAMSNSAGIFQVDELLATKLRGSGLEEHIEVIARIDAEHEQLLGAQRTCFRTNARRCGSWRTRAGCTSCLTNSAPAGGW
jgi:metal-dependent HD superfamily phosphatase/phosphodiesterase